LIWKHGGDVVIKLNKSEGECMPIILKGAGQLREEGVVAFVAKLCFALVIGLKQEQLIAI